MWRTCHSPQNYFITKGKKMEEQSKAKLKNKFNIKDKVIDYMMEAGKDNGFSNNEVEKMIEEYLSSVTLLLPTQ
jgi:hypothetical protein